MMKATPPQVIEQAIYRFDCKLNELVSYKCHSEDLINNHRFIVEDENIVLFSVQCNDGIFILVWEKRI